MRFHLGLSQGLGGFGLSLLGAVAGIVDQPIQGIRRASDVREAASGIITVSYTHLTLPTIYSV